VEKENVGDKVGCHGGVPRKKGRGEGGIEDPLAVTVEEKVSMEKGKKECDGVSCRTERGSVTAENRTTRRRASKKRKG